MWVKICGNTNPEDARAAVEAGADALGFIFAPSPRRVSPKDAGKIIAELPAQIEKIGVFLNQSLEIVLDTIEKAGLTGVQLHGDEDVEFAREVRRRARRLRIYKSLSLEDLDHAMARGASLTDVVFSALLLDSSAGARQGGTGKTFSWREAAPVVRFLSRKTKIVIAGGLRVDNVAQAIELFRPWGVDVVSGVEREPGKKDLGKLREFVAAVRASESADRGANEETQGPSTRRFAPRSG